VGDVCRKDVLVKNDAGEAKVFGMELLEKYFSD
jgi:hypothetical protein